MLGINESADFRSLNVDDAFSAKDQEPEYLTNCFTGLNFQTPIFISSHWIYNRVYTFDNLLTVKKIDEKFYRTTYLSKIVVEYAIGDAII